MNIYKRQDFVSFYTHLISYYFGPQMIVIIVIFFNIDNFWHTTQLDDLDSGAWHFNVFPDGVI